MEDYVIYTDAAADLPPDLCARHHIRGVPMEYILQGTIHTFSPVEPEREAICARLYAALREQVDISTTQIIPFVYEELFAPELEAGRDVLYCCFSSGMSATYQNAMTAKAALEARFPDRRLCFVDSRSAACGQGLFALQAALNREKGMSLAENASWLEGHAQNVNHWFTVADLDFLKRGGRVSPTLAFLGGKLQIKPMLTIRPDGSLSVFEKVRGRKRSIARMVELYRAHLDFGEAAPLVWLDYAGCPEEARELAQAVEEVSPPGTQVVAVPISPIIGAHVGPDMMSVCHFGTRREA